MENNDVITITVTGDFCPIGRVQDQCLKNKFSEIYGDVLPLLHGSDLAITNLECPLTDNLDPIAKIGPNLSASTQCIELLKLAKFGVVTLANNHVMDQSASGMYSTIHECDKHGINTVGAGSDLEAASKPLYVKVKGHTVAIINCAEFEFSIADRRSPGANPLDLVRVYYAVKEAKKHTNTILLIIHGGHEQYEYPSTRMVDTYRFIADLGVTAVIGHHTHCVSGYEWWNGVPIVYSLGNFLFDWQACVIPGFNQGALVDLQIIDGGVTNLVVTPFYQCKEEVSLELMKGQDKEKFCNRMEEINKVIADRDEMERCWQDMLDRKEAEYIPSLLTMGRYERYLFRHGITLPKDMKQKRLLRLLNLIRCEAHRDISIDILLRNLNIGTRL